MREQRLIICDMYFYEIKSIILCLRSVIFLQFPRLMLLNLRQCLARNSIPSSVDSQTMHEIDQKNSGTTR